MRSQEMTVDELKAGARKYKEIKPDGDNAKWVPLESWKGFSASTDVHLVSAQVSYYLEGNRVLVRKALDDKEYWYTLR
jgi:hypothetical protein